VDVYLWTTPDARSSRAHDVLVDVDEALARAGRGAAVSHELAARTWGIELVDDGQRRLTVPRNRSRLTVDGWQVHRADLRRDEVSVAAGRRTTSPLRTLSDLARALDHRAAVVAADSALRLGEVGLEELLGSLRAAWGGGAGRVRRVGRDVDPASGSVLETLLRLLLWSSPLPRPVTQHVVLDRGGSFVARVDFCWPAQRLVVEADGFAFHADRAAYRRDRDRLNELERLGWRVLRVTWEDVVARPAHVLALVAECLEAPVLDNVC